MQDDFVDLRGDNLSSESFWPSFTDIMMVVVMIFLLTSTILMVRNWELIEQLKQSILAEREASQMIEYTSKENATLEEQLANAQNEISLLRVQLMQASESAMQLQNQVADRDQQIIIMTGEKQNLQNALTDRDSEVERLTAEQASMTENLATVRLDLDRQSKELKTAQDRIVILSKEKRSSQDQLANLEENYETLRSKYEKLIKPARTAKGKYVVEVHYRRIDGVEKIRFKDAGEERLRTITAEELHAALSEAKKANPKKLYVKIIIPKDSGLSYSEAWTFMKGLLEKYDYYYQ